MSGYVVYCFLDANGLPVPVSPTNKLPILDSGALPTSSTPSIIYGTDTGGEQKDYPINAADGVVVTDANNKISASQLPPLDHDVGKAANQTEMLALAVTAPAVCIRTDFNPPHVFYLTADPATLLTNWTDTGEFGAGGANPSVTVGLTAKNGSAATFLRSDGAPALDQTIAPTWTAKHTFTGAGGSATPSVSIASAIPVLEINYTGGGADAKKWNWLADTNRIAFRAINDAGNTASEAWGVTRAAGVVTVHEFTTGGTVRLTIGGNDLAAGAAYIPSNPKSLTTKEYVDSGVDSRTAIVGGDGKTAQSADINMPNVYTALASGLYRVSAYMVLTRAATTSAVFPSLSVEYTEASTGIGMADLMITSTSANTVGTHQGGTTVIAAQAGTTIGYVTGNYASVGATTMQYAVHMHIEFLG